jgi:esterase
MKLHHRIIGEGEPLFILHGLFGSSDNWQTLGKLFAEKFQVIFVDQRNHGRSPWSDEFNYDLMVADFKELVDDLGFKKINVLGHSMGGKTVIGFAAKYPQLIDKIIVADISHKEYPLHHDLIIDGLKSLDLSAIKSRGQADRELSKFIKEMGVRQFLLKNLYWIEKGQLAWRINIAVLAARIHDILAEIKFDTIPVETLFIRGGRSNYIVENDYPALNLKFPNSSIHSIEESGHWVHAEAPEEFYNTVTAFFAD